MKDGLGCAVVLLTLVIIGCAFWVYWIIYEWVKGW